MKSNPTLSFSMLDFNFQNLEINYIFFINAPIFYQKLYVIIEILQHYVLNIKNMNA